MFLIILRKFQCITYPSVHRSNQISYSGQMSQKQDKTLTTKSYLSSSSRTCFKNCAKISSFCLAWSFSYHINPGKPLDIAEVIFEWDCLNKEQEKREKILPQCLLITSRVQGKTNNCDKTGSKIPSSFLKNPALRRVRIS